MSILDKVMFWKKKNEFGDIGLGNNNPSLGAQDLGLSPTTGGMDNFGQSPSGNVPGFDQSSPTDLNMSQPQMPTAPPQA